MSLVAFPGKPPYELFPLNEILEVHFINKSLNDKGILWLAVYKISPKKLVR